MIISSEALIIELVIFLFICFSFILYVTYGAGHAFGIDLDKCFEEVQKSNMSKLDQHNKPIYDKSGKVMKGPQYFKPDLNKFLK